MPLFNLDEAITAVTTTHAECAQISRDIETNKQERYTLNSKQAMLSVKLSQLELDTLRMTRESLNAEWTERSQIPESSHSERTERTLTQEEEALEQQIIETSREYSRVQNQQLRDEATIGAFNTLPIAKPITEAMLTADRGDLKHQIDTIKNEKRTNLENDFDLKTQRFVAQKALTDAVKALQDEYNQSALTLAVLCTCAVVALVLLEVLTLPVAAPVLLVSLAAIGLWRYNQTTNPEVLSNDSPAP